MRFMGEKVNIIILQMLYTLIHVFTLIPIKYYNIFYEIQQEIGNSKNFMRTNDTEQP